MSVSTEDDIDTLDVNSLLIQDTPDETPVSCSQVLCMKSPFFYCYYNEVPCKVTIDSGAESNIVSLSFV